MTQEPDRPTLTQEGSMSNARSSVRWWPAKSIVSLALLAIVYVRFIHEDSHQHRNIQTLVIGLLTVALLWLWLLLASRLPWKVRGLICGGALGVLSLMAGLFEGYGVSGDLVPLMEFCWGRLPSFTAR